MFGTIPRKGELPVSTTELRTRRGSLEIQSSSPTTIFLDYRKEMSERSMETISRS